MKSFISWVSEGLWTVILFVMLVIPFFLESFYNSNHLAFYGAICQILGVSLVIWGVNDKIESLGLKRLRTSLSEWFKRCPFYKQKEITGSGQIQLDLHLNVKGNVTISTDIESMDTKDALLYLNKQMVKITDMHMMLANEFDIHKTEMESKISKTKESLKKDINTKTTLIHSSLINGVIAELFGSITIIIGIIYGTIPNQMILFFNKIRTLFGWN